LITLIIEQILNGLLTGSMYVMMALGFSLIWGILGMFNFAHGALYMLGAYISFSLITWGLNPYIAILSMMCIMFFLGVLIEKFCIRPFGRYRGTMSYVMNCVIVTLSLAIAFETAILLIYGGEFKTVHPFVSGVIVLGPFQISNQMIYSFLIGVISIVAFSLFIKYTRIGLGMRALAQEPIAASMMGLNPDVIYSITFGISSALAGLSGAILAPVYSIYPSVGWVSFLYAFIVVVLGGLGSMSGVIAAGFMVGIIKNVGSIWLSGQWIMTIIFGSLILVLLLRPRGLFGTRVG
jgi:branched-chain amino acid transport system permease protein